MSNKTHFDLTNRVAFITGGAGLLGVKHAEAIAEQGGVPVLADMDGERAEEAAEGVRNTTSGECYAVQVDITDAGQVQRAVSQVLERSERIDILINNAAMTVKGGGASYADYFAPFEEYPQHLWEEALNINLTGAFLVTQAVGKIMRDQKRGSIINIASDVGLISPDHRIYENETFNTPIAYAVSKAGLINFTRYLATYWAEQGIRANALCPAGVYNNHSPEFVEKLASRIPLARMAHQDEYKGAIVFLASDASSFMTGSTLVVDGGRTSW